MKRHLDGEFSDLFKMTNEQPFYVRVNKDVLVKVEYDGDIQYKLALDDKEKTPLTPLEAEQKYKVTKEDILKAMDIAGKEKKMEKEPNIITKDRE